MGEFCSDNFRQEKKRKGEEQKQKEPKQSEAAKDFTKVKYPVELTRTRGKMLPWEYFVPAEETKLTDVAANKEAAKFKEDAALEEARGYKSVANETSPMPSGTSRKPQDPLHSSRLRRVRMFSKLRKQALRKSAKKGRIRPQNASSLKLRRPRCVSYNNE